MYKRRERKSKFEYQAEKIIAISLIYTLIRIKKKKEKKRKEKKKEQKLQILLTNWIKALKHYFERIHEKKNKKKVEA